MGQWTWALGLLLYIVPVLVALPGGWARASRVERKALLWGWGLISGPAMLLSWLGIGPSFWCFGSPEYSLWMLPSWSMGACPPWLPVEDLVFYAVSVPLPQLIWLRFRRAAPTGLPRGLVGGLALVLLGVGLGARLALGPPGLPWFLLWICLVALLPVSVLAWRHAARLRDRGLGWVLLLAVWPALVHELLLGTPLGLWTYNPAFMSGVRMPGGISLEALVAACCFALLPPLVLMELCGWMGRDPPVSRRLGRS